MADILFDIGIIILFAAILANFVRAARQPLILGYVIAGVLIGPSVFGIIKNTELIKILAELGIAFLLFIVGMELDLKKLKEVGKFTSFAGIIQVIVVTLISMAVAMIWLNTVEAMYIGLIIALSSTMVVVKLLSDANELDTLHSRIIIGILVVQDIIAIIALPLLAGAGALTLGFVGLALAKAALLLALAYLVGKALLKYVMKSSAKNNELLFITAIATCFLFVGLGIGLGFSIAIGAFIAGLIVGNSPYSIEITGRVKSLRDFFAVIFFVALGSQIQIGSIAQNIGLFFVLLVLVLILKPLIFFILLKLGKHSNRTSFTASISLAQISEFSLVLALAGLSLGALSQETFDVIIVLAIITITLTSYFIKYHKGLFKVVEDLLAPLDKKSSKHGLEYLPEKSVNHFVVFGIDKMGTRIVKRLHEHKKKLIAVDYNPDTIKALVKEKVPCIYGDFGNLDVLHAARIGKAQMVVSTIPSIQENLVLLLIVKGVNKKTVTFFSASSRDDALKLYEHGADFVAVPEIIVGQEVSDYILKYKPKTIKKEGAKYYKEFLDHKKQNHFI